MILDKSKLLTICPKFIDRNGMFEDLLHDPDFLCMTMDNVSDFSENELELYSTLYSRKRAHRGDIDATESKIRYHVDFDVWMAHKGSNIRLIDRYVTFYQKDDPDKGQLGGWLMPTLQFNDRETMMLYKLTWC